MNLLFEASRKANMWPSATIKQWQIQFNTLKLEGQEAESHAGIANPSRNW